MTTSIGKQLELSEDVKNEITNNHTFKAFIYQIEKGLFEYRKKKEGKIESKLLLEEDWEIPNNFKIILLIKFEGISFETELQDWKEINDSIFKLIQIFIDNSSEKLKNEFEALKKKFFIKLNLS